MRNPSSSSKAKSSSSPAATPTKTPCCVKVGLKRGPWTPEEDELLSNYIKKEGEGRWRTLPKRAGLLRCGKSCRLRWMNYLRPSVKRGQIAPDEEDLILRLHRLLGNRWSLIAGRIPGRTDNEIKNYWNTHLSKKLINQGIDPRTHKPLNPDNCSSAGGGDHHAVSHHGANSSSAKANQTNPRPSSNPNPKSPITSPSLVSTEEEEEQAAAPTIGGYNISTDDLGIIVHGGAGYGSLNSDGSALRSNTGVMLMGNGEDEDINCCTDDVFSSFLNSLINEDPFAVAGHHQMQMPQLQQQQPSNGVAAPQPAGGDSLATAAGFGGWESAVLMSSAFIQNDPHRGNVNQTE